MKNGNLFSTLNRIFKLAAIYALMRMIGTFFLLLFDGHRGWGLISNSLFFGVYGGGLVLAFSLAASFPLKILRCNPGMFFQLALAYSLIFYFLTNSLILVAGRTDSYFLLGIYTGVKYKLYCIAVLACSCAAVNFISTRIKK